jgi:NOP5NT (NUC127) domain
VQPLAGCYVAHSLHTALCCQVQSFYTLYESASGYALLEVVEAEEVGSLLDEVQASVTDLQRFSRTVKLKAFQPFTSAENALENMNAVSEQIVTQDLQNFLEMNLPKVGILYITLIAMLDATLIFLQYSSTVNCSALRPLEQACTT